MSIIHRQQPTRESDPAAAAAAELEAARIAEQTRLVREQGKRDRRDAKEADRKVRRARRRQERSDTLSTFAGRARLLAPLLAVNAAAVYGQVSYAADVIAPTTWAEPARLGLGIFLGATLETIAVYVGWHAHRALLEHHTGAAARLRRWSYAIAAVVAAVNYAHFADPVPGDAWDLAPTPAAIVFGFFSFLSPILWGLHSRREHRIQLAAEGVVDCQGAVFSAERFRHFPIRTMMARRWSIEHNVTDPVAAWIGYNAERDTRRVSRPRAGFGRAQVDSGRSQSSRPQSAQVDPPKSTSVDHQSGPVESAPSRPQSGDRSSRPKSTPTTQSTDRPVWATSDNPQYLAAAHKVDSDQVAAIVAWYRANGATGRITPGHVQEVTGITGEYPKRATRDAAIYALNGSHNA